MGDKEIEMVEVILVQDHTHAGVKSLAGSKITLPREDADWLANTIVETRIVMAEVAATLPGTPEFQFAKPSKK